MQKTKVIHAIDSEFKSLLRCFHKDSKWDSTQALIDYSNMVVVARLAIEILGDWHYYDYLMCDLKGDEQYDTERNQTNLTIRL